MIFDYIVEFKSWLDGYGVEAVTLSIKCLAIFVKGRPEFTKPSGLYPRRKQLLLIS
jgi:hypothetical protein